MATQPLDVYEAIKDAYLRYYDTAFRLRDGGLRDERRALLEQPGVVFTDPLIEPVLPYAGDERLVDVCEKGGVGADVGEKLADMLFGAGTEFRLRAHQATALRASLGEAEKHNVVVTS